MRVMIKDIFESMILVSGSSKEQLERAKDGLEARASGRELDELLLTNLRNRIVKSFNAGKSKNDMRTLMDVTYYVMSRYQIFHEMENVDLVIDMATHMIKIANEDEINHYMAPPIAIDPVTFVKEIDYTLTMLEGEVIDTGNGFILNTYTARDMWSAVKNMSEVCPELEFKINWVEDNVGKFTKHYKGGEEFTPEPVKLLPSNQRRVDFEIARYK